MMYVNYELMEYGNIYILISIWASSRETLSPGAPKKWDANQPAQLQRLAWNMKFLSQ